MIKRFGFIVIPEEGILLTEQEYELATHRWETLGEETREMLKEGVEEEGFTK